MTSTGNKKILPGSQNFGRPRNAKMPLVTLSAAAQSRSIKLGAQPLGPQTSIPEPTLRRLPRYYHYLKSLQNHGRDVVSCTHIGKDLGLDPTQIRKDLAFTGIRGLPRVGFQISALLEAIESFFGWNNIDEAVLVGVDNLGRALLNYRGLAACGFKIIAAFDNDPKVVGQNVGGVEVLLQSKLSDLCRRLNVHIGIITTPDHAAQEVADMLVEGGVIGIWNFAPAEIQVPDGVIVQSENLAAGLSVLGKKLHIQRSGKKNRRSENDESATYCHAQVRKGL